MCLLALLVSSHPCSILPYQMFVGFDWSLYIYCPFWCRDHFHRIQVQTLSMSPHVDLSNTTGVQIVWFWLLNTPNYNVYPRLWHDFAKTLKYLWNNFYTTFTLLWHNFERTSTQLWHNFDTTLTTLWHNFNKTITQLWNNFDTTLRQLWDSFEITCRQLW